MDLYKLLLRQDLRILFLRRDLRIRNYCYNGYGGVPAVTGPCLVSTRWKVLYVIYVIHGRARRAGRAGRRFARSI